MTRASRTIWIPRSTVALTAVVVAVACSAGPSATVVNGSGATLTNVRVQCTGGEATLGTLEPGETRSAIMLARGESSAVLVFTDTAGVVHTQELDVYFENGYKGSLTIRIAPDLQVSVENKIRPSYGIFLYLAVSPVRPLR